MKTEVIGLFCVYFFVSLTFINTVPIRDSSENTQNVAEKGVPKVANKEEKSNLALDENKSKVNLKPDNTQNGAEKDLPKVPHKEEKTNLGLDENKSKVNVRPDNTQKGAERDLPKEPHKEEKTNLALDENKSKVNVRPPVPVASNRDQLPAALTPYKPKDKKNDFFKPETVNDGAPEKSSDNKFGNSNLIPPLLSSNEDKLKDEEKKRMSNPDNTVEKGKNPLPKEGVQKSIMNINLLDEASKKSEGLVNPKVKPPNHLKSSSNGKASNGGDFNKEEHRVHLNSKSSVNDNPTVNDGQQKSGDQKNLENLKNPDDRKSEENIKKRKFEASNEEDGVRKSDETEKLPKPVSVSKNPGKLLKQNTFKNRQDVQTADVHKESKTDDKNTKASSKLLKTVTGKPERKDINNSKKLEDKKVESILPKKPKMLNEKLNKSNVTNKVKKHDSSKISQEDQTVDVPKNSNKPAISKEHEEHIKPFEGNDNKKKSAEVMKEGGKVLKPANAKTYEASLHTEGKENVKNLDNTEKAMARDKKIKTDKNDSEHSQKKLSKSNEILDVTSDKISPNKPKDIVGNKNPNDHSKYVGNEGLEDTESESNELRSGKKMKGKHDRGYGDDLTVDKEKTLNKMEGKLSDSVIDKSELDKNRNKSKFRGIDSKFPSDNNKASFFRKHDPIVKNFSGSKSIFSSRFFIFICLSLVAAIVVYVVYQNRKKTFGFLRKRRGNAGSQRMEPGTEYKPLSSVDSN